MSSRSRSTEFLSEVGVSTAAVASSWTATETGSPWEANLAWICVDLDDTLLQQDPMSGDYTMPSEGAVEAMQTLAGEGHRLTIFTARFNPAPAEVKQQMKEEIEEMMMQLGFPPMEVWTGTTKPSADIFIDNNAVTYDNDWGLVLAQTDQMLEDRGLIPGPQPGAAEAQLSQDEEQPAEGEGEQQ
jgi:hypothetical protein